MKLNLKLNLKLQMKKLVESSKAGAGMFEIGHWDLPDLDLGTSSVNTNKDERSKPVKTSGTPIEQTNKEKEKEKEKEKDRDREKDKDKELKGHKELREHREHKEQKEHEIIHHSSLPILGWREWVALPDLGISQIKAKIDSGARTSALHANDIVLFTRGGKKMVRFKIYPFQKNQKKFKEVESLMIGSRPVKSSIGSMTIRPVIITPIRIGKLEWPIEITLVNRDLMGFRMLIGRQAIRRNFLIDPGRSYLIGKKKRRTLIFPF